MAESFVEWRGLTELIHYLENVERRASRDMAILTEDTGEKMAQLYRDNLAGDVPSTENNPLPVGMRSSELYEGVRLEIVNQYAFDLYNDTPHAGWIEDGTRYIFPRRPLGDAVQQIEEVMDTNLDEVMVGIIEE